MCAHAKFINMVKENLKLLRLATLNSKMINEFQIFQSIHHWQVRKIPYHYLSTNLQNGRLIDDSTQGIGRVSYVLYAKLQIFILPFMKIFKKYFL